MMQGRDLFGQVVVTWPEIYAWCEDVAGIARDSPRLAGYVKAWDVPAKIAAAKLQELPPPSSGRRRPTDA